MEINRGYGQYNPDKFNCKIGELIEYGKDIEEEIKTKSGLKNYKEKINLAKSPQDFLNLGFNKHKIPLNDDRFAFVKKGEDVVVFDSSGNKVE